MITFSSEDNVIIKKINNLVIVAKKSNKPFTININATSNCTFKTLIVFKSTIDTFIEYEDGTIVKPVDNEHKCLFSSYIESNNKIKITTNNCIIFKDTYVEHISEFFYLRFENVFVINLEKDIERRNKIVELMLKNNIVSYRFIGGERGKNGYGHEGCYNSHLKCLKKALETNSNHAIILEDDVIFCDDFMNIFNNIKIPTNYNMLYLGGITQHVKIMCNSAMPIKNYYVMGAYGYIINKNFLVTLIKIIEKNVGKPIDHIYVEFVQKHHPGIYILDDLLTTSVDDLSNTSKKSQKFYDCFKKIFVKYLKMN